MIINWIGSQAAIGIQDHYVNDTANYYFSELAGWIIAGLIALSAALTTVSTFASRRRLGLPLQNPWLAVVRVGFIAGMSFLVVAICNRDRGVPFAGLLIVAMILFWTFIAKRTTFGRHVYAVGGNAEATRRAGITVPFVRICVFMISGAMAALGGVVLAARLQGVDLQAGGGALLLERDRRGRDRRHEPLRRSRACRRGAARVARDHDDLERARPARLELRDRVHHHRDHPPRRGDARHALAAPAREVRPGVEQWCRSGSAC